MLPPGTRICRADQLLLRKSENIVKTTSAIFRLAMTLVLPAMVVSLQAQNPPATNPGVTLPPRITRTNTPDQTAPAAAVPAQAPPPITTLATPLPTNASGQRFPPPTFRALTNP